eukprot:TRINITY_DN1732_c0_g1_i1.p1 TRINITY_DN1732_c0_g1~~TRINITY_DN1732_c0_g1_i1.p1  ORF type:complete len:388 (-),score=114.85 TRINITY_DN1732_c0_g1_i1:43-1206(-)
MDEEEKVEKLPNLQYAEWKYMLTLPDSQVQNKQDIRTKLMEAITNDNASFLYRSVCEDLKIPVDNALLEKMKKANEEKLQQLDATIKDATENLGESEVRDALAAKADYYARIGDKDNAVSQYRLTLEKTVGSGQKLDVIFTVLRIGLFWMDHDLIKRNLERAFSMVNEGTDWDRKNRLKVYDALYALSVRDFKKAANQLLDTISTFTAVELLDYQEYIFYTVVMCIVSLDRVTLKQKVINAPEILTVIDNIPHLGNLLNSLYNCSYNSFFVALAGISDTLKQNRFLAAHVGYFCKELRVIAYNQMLESYRSVQLETMAEAFGVTPEFLDREISRFIASGRLHCKIDKVGGIVETNRPDSKNAQYQNTIKQGDLLLNRVQKLSRVINI